MAGETHSGHPKTATFPHLQPLFTNHFEVKATVPEREDA